MHNKLTFLTSGVPTEVLAFFDLPSAAGFFSDKASSTTLLSASASNTFFEGFLLREGEGDNS